LKYALSAFSITVAVVLIAAAIFPFFQKPAHEREGSKKKDQQSRSARIKRFLKMSSSSLMPSRGPASVSPLLFDEPDGVSAALKPGGLGSSRPKSLTENIETLEAAWREVEALHPQDSAHADHASMTGLCKQNLAFACDRYYRHEKSRYFEALEKARAMAPGSERGEILSRLKAVRGRLDQFAKMNCVAGNPFGCQDVVDQPGGGDLMNIIKSYCLGGGIEYCMTVGFALLNRWSRGLKRAKPVDVRSPPLEVVLDEARTFMAKGCQAGSLEACSELLQGPLAETTDSRTALALEFFDRLCREGDPAACVTVAGALYSGDREEVAEAVREYCELRARPGETNLNDDERAVCSRLAKNKMVDDALWAQMTGLMYEGPRLSARVLDHLAPGR